jgi:uncharacterized protein (TIGR01244 family)
MEAPPWTPGRSSSGLSVSPQITAEDLPAIADQGFRAIICNRPDGEGMDQPTFEEIEPPPGRSGLEARYLPVTAGKVRDEDAEAFGAALPSCPARCWPIAAPARARRRSGRWPGRTNAAAARHPRRHQGGRLRHERRRAPHRQWRQDADRYAATPASTW